MNDYISREDVQGQIVKAAEKCQIKLFDKSVNAILQILQNMPAADVQSVKHGRCVIDNEGYERCSVCNEHETGMRYFTFCPRCGAKIGR